MDAAARHRRIAGAFSALVRGTVDWDAPAPVAGWSARDVVGHLVSWLPAFLAAGSQVPPWSGPTAADDPVGAWFAQADAVQALLEDPATADRILENPHTGALPLAEAIDRFYTTDLFMHTWDLARATGQPHDLEEQECAALLAGMEPLDQLLRDSGQYGPRVAVADDASAQDRLIAFIGRDPAWRAGLSDLAD